MLILRRRAGETILIGDEIKVTVLDVYDGGVRLAIDAPRRITILRSELLQAVNVNRDSAASANERTQPRKIVKFLTSGGNADDKQQEADDTT